MKYKSLAVLALAAFLPLSYNTSAASIQNPKLRYEVTNGKSTLYRQDGSVLIKHKEIQSKFTRAKITVKSSASQSKSATINDRTLIAHYPSTIFSVQEEARFVPGPFLGNNTNSYVEFTYWVSGSLTQRAEIKIVYDLGSVASSYLARQEKGKTLQNKPNVFTGDQIPEHVIFTRGIDTHHKADIAFYFITPPQEISIRDRRAVATTNYEPPKMYVNDKSISLVVNYFPEEIRKKPKAIKILVGIPPLQTYKQKLGSGTLNISYLLQRDLKGIFSLLENMAFDKTFNRVRGKYRIHVDGKKQGKDGRIDLRQYTTDSAVHLQGHFSPIEFKKIPKEITLFFDNGDKKIEDFAPVIMLYQPPEFVKAEKRRLEDEEK